MTLFVALSYGTGWGCISEYGPNVMKQCASETLPADTTGLSDTDTCRYSDNNLLTVGTCSFAVAAFTI